MTFDLNQIKRKFFTAWQQYNSYTKSMLYYYSFIQLFVAITIAAYLAFYAPCRKTQGCGTFLFLVALGLSSLPYFQ